MGLIEGNFKTGGGIVITHGRKSSEDLVRSYCLFPQKRFPSMWNGKTNIRTKPSSHSVKASGRLNGISEEREECNNRELQTAPG